MSNHARRQRRRDRHLCACGRHAVYLRPRWGSAAWRRDHPLCPRCWAGLLERQRAEQHARDRCVRVGFLNGMLQLA